MRQEGSRPEHNFKAPRIEGNNDVLNIDKEDLDDERLPDVRSEIERLSKEFLNYETPDLDFDNPVDYESKRKDQQRRDRLSREMRNLEMEYLSKLYRDVKYSTLVKLPKHHLQNNPLACTLASTLNILEVFKLRGGLSENDIANSIGEDGSRQTINIDKTLDFLKTKGLQHERVKSVLEIIQRLIDGQVIMYTIPGEIAHRVVISAVMINKGKIDFLFNDPLKEDPYWVPYQEIVNIFPYDPQARGGGEAIIKEK